MADVAALQTQIATMRSEMDQLYTDVDTAWLVLTGAIVFFMQAGFSMLEAGAVSSKNVINILYKNVMDGAIAAVCFWLLGYGIGFGETAGGIVGTSYFALSDLEEQKQAHFFFQWAFAGTAATIVSGSVAERTKFEAYLMFSAICSIAIYPPVVHWVWGEGFLSARAFPDEDGSFKPLFSRSSDSNGVIDFGGSGVVHMLGGFSGLMGAVALGPRRGRFDADGAVLPMPPHNTSMMALGATILWFGWYAFNCGSTLQLSHHMAVVAGKVAVNTTIAGATGALMATVLSRVFEHTFDIGMAINGLLAGMVAVTAPCALCDAWGAFLIGAIAPAVYYSAHRALLRLGVDDPLDAFPIHGCCGAFGLLSVGIFCQDKYVVWAGFPHDNNSCSRGEQLGVQLVAVLLIATWSLVMSAMTFYGLKATIGIRVPEEVENEGLDVSEHGGNAYFDAMPPPESPKRRVKPDPNPITEHRALPAGISPQPVPQEPAPGKAPPVVGGWVAEDIDTAEPAREVGWETA